MRRALGGLGLAFLCACGEPRFAYEPSPPVVPAGPLFAVDAVVLPLKDETEAFQQRYERKDGRWERDLDLPRVASPTWPRLTAERVTEALAAELGNSGLFRSVRLGGPDENAVSRREVVVFGALREASLHARDPLRGTYKLALELEAHALTPRYTDVCDARPADSSESSPLTQLPSRGEDARPPGLTESCEWGLDAGNQVWAKTIRREAERSGRRPSLEQRELLRGMLAEAVQELPEALRARASFAGAGSSP